MSQTFTTPKGTVLPLLSLKGKLYMQVAHRVQWFVEENASYEIDVTFPVLNEDVAIAKAVITVSDGNNTKTVQGTKKETKKDFPDHIEKAETGAIGRALALLGYGTQFALELDEGERLADSPQQPARDTRKAPISQPRANQGHSSPAQAHPGDYVIEFGKHKGKSIDELGLKEAVSYAQWLSKNAQTSGKPMGDSAREFCDFVQAYEQEMSARADTGFATDMEIPFGK